MSNPLQSQAAGLLKKLIAERGKDVLAKPIKQRPTAKALLAAEPELQMAYVCEVVRVFGKLGARKAKRPTDWAWFHEEGVPRGGRELAKMLMRRRLPFGEEMLAEMLEQIAGMDFVTFAPVVEQLVRELEKRAAEAPLSPRIRKAAAGVADGLLVKDWPQADAENWGLPRATDRKLAGRIERLLAGPLDLSRT
jgi:hypothetical protein